MANAFEIRKHLVQYLGGVEPLEQFEEWFARNTWNLHQENDPDAEKLAAYVELALAEYTGGVLDPTGLAQRLSHAIQDQRITLSFAGGYPLVAEAFYDTATTARAVKRSKVAVGL